MNYIVDGTFKIVPKGPLKQLLIVFIDYKEKVITRTNTENELKFIHDQFKTSFLEFIYRNTHLFSCMKRTKKAYSFLFSYIDESIYKFNTKSFITDFEKGLRVVLKELFPESKLLGCWFHYKQVILRKITTKFKALRGFSKTSPDAMDELKKY